MKYVGIKLTKYVEKMKKKCGKCVQHWKLQNTSKKLKLNNYPETNRYHPISINIPLGFCFYVRINNMILNMIEKQEPSIA